MQILKLRKYDDLGSAMGRWRFTLSYWFFYALHINLLFFPQSLVQLAGGMSDSPSKASAQLDLNFCSGWDPGVHPCLVPADNKWMPLSRVCWGPDVQLLRSSVRWMWRSKWGTPWHAGAECSTVIQLLVFPPLFKNLILKTIGDSCKLDMRTIRVEALLVFTSQVLWKWRRLYAFLVPEENSSLVKSSKHVTVFRNTQPKM